MQQISGNIRSLYSSGALSSGNRAGGRTAVRTKAFQQLVRRAEAEAQQARLQVQDLRRACEGLQSQIDRMREESEGNRCRRYDEGRGEFPALYCGGGPPPCRLR